MAPKFVVLALLVAAVSGSGSHGGDYSSLSYGVSDLHIGDVKSQHETRQGGNLVGQYFLHESDGTRRTVDYAADPHSSFNAIVRKNPAFIGYAAPVATAPTSYAASLAHAATPAVSTSAYSTSVVHGAIAHSAYTAPLGHGSYGAAPLSYTTSLDHGSYRAASLGYGSYGATPSAHGSYETFSAGAHAGLGAGWAY